MCFLGEEMGHSERREPNRTTGGRTVEDDDETKEEGTK